MKTSVFPEQSLLVKLLKDAKEKGYKVIPFSAEILMDFITPIEALKLLKAVSGHAFILESVVAQEKWGRYTFLGFEPKMEITLKDHKLKLGDKEIETERPDLKLKELLKNYQSPKLSNLPSFTGGLVGYFGFDYVRYAEPTLDPFFKKERALRDESLNEERREAFKDLDLMLFDKVIAFDNLKQKLILIVNLSIEDVNLSDESAIAEAATMMRDKAQAELQVLVELLTLKTYKGSKVEVDESTNKGELLSEFTPVINKEDFVEMVNKAKHHIHEGDIFQIVLSNRLKAKFQGSLFDTYRVLRTLNPSPYMFYFSGMSLEVVGASPETLVKLEDGVLHTFPLAGTRPRGKTEAEDLALEKELLADEKELAEHNMLVDLGRNDLGKISKFGTVKVEKFHCIERYSHVMHIGSTVRSEISEQYDALDAIASVLPAGTLSGAPKVRACELIQTLEQDSRGIYGGAIGYVAFNGNMDTCIAIRLAYKNEDDVFVRSGAGIVADSNPESEYLECINKAKAVVTALAMANEVSKG